MPTDESDVIYKVCAAAEWREAVARGSYAGSAVDLRDGFIHFSTGAQLAETLRRHFAGRRDLVRVAFDPSALGPALRWEPSRGGDLFPHLYGALPAVLARSTSYLDVDEGGEARVRPAPEAGVTSLPRVDLLDLSHAEARRLLARGMPVYLPVNPVEYHGPHLSLRNDHLVSMGLAADLHARIAGGEGRDPWPFVVASSVEAGVEPVAGIGSRPVDFRTVRRLAIDACEALIALGARRIVIMTFHGAPLHAHALDAAVQACEARGVPAIQPLNLLMRQMMSIEPGAYADLVAHVDDGAERAAILDELHVDFHAGFAETSLALHYAKGSVDDVYQRLPPCPTITPDAALMKAAQVATAAGKSELALELRVAAFGRGWAALRPFPGYTGRPHRASAGTGALLARRIVDGYVTTTRDVFAGGESPRPIMPWIVSTTLGGLIPGMSVPIDEVMKFGT
ncbi:MAG: DUF952 domain-containing protein [Byssovorax sp.]